MPPHRGPASRVACPLAALLCAGGVAMMPGCIVGSLVGGMAQSYHDTGSTTFPAEYTGLVGKSFAVVVSADRVVQAEEPGLTARVTQRVNDTLMRAAGASHGIPTRDLLGVLYNKPQWQAMAPSDVAELLGVQRLVWVEISEYRLREPGNQYIWAGLCQGLVTVYAADGALPDDPMYEKRIAVRYPAREGMMATDIPETVVASELSRRFTDRVAWLFYEHEEANRIDY